MNRVKLVTLGIVGMVLIALISLPLVQVQAEEKSGGKKGNFGRYIITRLHKRQIPDLTKAIEQAIEAIKADNKKLALDKLGQAKGIVAQVKKSVDRYMKKHAKAEPGFVNNKCPIMGTPIKPDKVTADLTMEYKGKKVALCCTQCIAKWNALSDAQKEMKLKAKAGHKMQMQKEEHSKPKDEHSGHDH